MAATPSSKYELLASTAPLVDGEGVALPTPWAGNGIAYVLDVTVVGGAADTLDVYIQTLLDGTNWLDVVHFTQISGAGAAIRHVAKQTFGLTEAMFNYATALAAGSVRQVVSDQIRVRWDTTVVAPAFVFSVVMVPF